MLKLLSPIVICLAVFLPASRNSLDVLHSVTGLIESFGDNFDHHKAVLAAKLPSLSGFPFLNNLELVPKGTPSYSSHFCFGKDTIVHLGRGNPKFYQFSAIQDPDHPICIFRNLVWDESEHFVYYQAPGTATDPAISSLRMYTQFGVGFTIQQALIPQSLQVVGDSRTAHLFSQVNPQFSWTTDTPGHSFDFVWSAFQAMVRTGLLSPRNKLVVLHRSTRPDTIFYDCLFCTLLGDVVHIDSMHKNIVFPLAVLNAAKTTQMSFPSFTSNFYFSLFKLRAKAIKGLQEPPLAPAGAKLRVGIHKKEGGHAFLNHDEIMAHLRMRDNLEVIELKAFNFTTENAELAAIDSLDIYITPGL
jgi:hypothetical protein